MKLGFRPKDKIDQPAHFIVGAALSGVFCAFLGSGWGGPLTFGLAFLRECFQHPDLKFGRGSIIDMTFWALGILFGWALWWLA